MLGDGPHAAPSSSALRWPAVRRAFPSRAAPDRARSCPSPAPRRSASRYRDGRAGRRFRRRPLGDDLALQHHRRAMRDAPHRAEIVGDEHIGEAELVLQPPQQLQHFLGDERIERRGRLVADDEVRLGGERARDADALLLAAGQLPRTPLGEIRAAGRPGVKQFGDAAPSLAAAGAAEEESDRPADDFAQRLARIERHIGHLMHHLQPAQHVARTLARAGARVSAGELHVAGPARQQAQPRRAPASSCPSRIRRPPRRFARARSSG